MPLLALLKAAWKHPVAVLSGLCLVLIMALWLSMNHIGRLQDALAAKPEAEHVVDTRTDHEIRRAGIKRTNKETTLPDGTKIKEKIEEIAKEDSVKSTDKHSEDSEKPVGLQARSPRWIAGLMVAPDVDKRIFGARAGVTIFSRFDIVYGYRFAGPWKGHQADLSLRF